MKTHAFKRRVTGTVISVAVSMLLGVGPALAVESSAIENINQDSLREALSTKIRIVQHMALNPVLIEAVKRQNAEALTAALIDQRDQEWQSTPDDHQFKLAMQKTEAGELLKSRVGDGSQYSEAFLTDKRGANVATFPATGDYNQGDEGKWSNSWNGGEGKIFIGEPEHDESSGKNAVQISAPVLDRGVTIGVLVVGVTFDYIGGKIQ